jgi:hypothetical protein
MHIDTLLRGGALAVALLGTVTAEAAVIYDEGTSGDFSNTGIAPTALGLVAGSNEILGSMGFTGTGLDRDYFALTVPTGKALTAIRALPGTEVAVGASFLGMQAGAQMTVSPNAFTAAGLLGWAHYSDPPPAGADLLPTMSVAGFGSSGFTIPLAAGSYTFWLQDVDGPASYHLDFVVANVAPVPLPGALALFAPALLGMLRGRKKG